MTPLLELVDLAARNGWELVGEDKGGLEWKRAGNSVWARFAKSSQRPQNVALINHHPAGDVCVFAGVGNGGDSEEAIDSLRKWFAMRPREAGQPTQW